MEYLESKRWIVRRVVRAASLAALASCGTEHAAPDEAAAAPVPADWTTAHGNCGLALTGPSTLAIPGGPGQGCKARFAAGCFYEASLGPGLEQFDPGPIGEGVSYSSEDTSIDGRPARLWISRGRAPSNHYIVGVQIFSVWSDSPETGLVLVGSCGSEAEQATGRAVLNTLRLPVDAAAAAVLLEPTPDCSGDDERSIEGYLLGSVCPGPRVRVPGVCAVGARRNGAFGTGDTLCFVAGADFYVAHVSFGEYLIGTGARNSRGQAWLDQLSVAEASRCAELIGQLPKADPTRPSITGEYFAPPCP